MKSTILLTLLPAVMSLYAQRAELRPADSISFPGNADSSSPLLWRNGEIQVYNSDAMPIVSFGETLEKMGRAKAILLDTYLHAPMWIESVWEDSDGTIYAWYHHEAGSGCESGLLAEPQIGMMVSSDGVYFEDWGIILSSGYPNNCQAQNGYFAGGHGDFNVILDQERRYFYFYFSNYSGPVSAQGVAVARMAFEDRKQPYGRVFKYYNGAWREPGLGGRVEAILPVAAPWEREDTDAYWGPAMHWNTHLNMYVMLLNRACCSAGWPPEGIHASFNETLENPKGWTAPELILSEAGWYPQAVGLEPGGTDKIVGEVGRFFMGSDSGYEIVFSR